MKVAQFIVPGTAPDGVVDWRNELRGYIGRAMGKL